MSKLDGLRAMREAKYAKNQARNATTPGQTPGRTTARAKAPVGPATGPAAETEASAGETTLDEAASVAPCGHQAISGRTCTREKGHAAKSHRYS